MAVPPGEGHPDAGGTDATYSRVAELPLEVERCELLPLARDTSSGFTKVSIGVRLTGNGHEGPGEDITWDQIDQIEQLRRARDLSRLRGTGPCLPFKLDASASWDDDVVAELTSRAGVVVVDMKGLCRTAAAASTA